jgi:cytochrome c biogenesis protein CcmG/thiol:disulfide interchange protein DsbE
MNLKIHPMKIPLRAIGLMVSGIGLIVIGIVVTFLLANNPANDPTQPTDFSAIPARVHYDAPTLTLNDIRGTANSLSNYLGQVVLVNLWATWCPPCKAEMPLLQDYYLHHKNEGFVVIAIEDGDPTPGVISFVENYGLTFPVWLDPTYQATDQAFKTKNLPSSYVIDRAGKVRLAWVGAINAANLEKYVTSIIKE